MVEKNISRDAVVSDYKKYIPRECIKKHSFFIRKPIYNALGKITGHNAPFVKEQYLNQFETIAPNYLHEEYKALMDTGIPDSPIGVTLRVNAIEVKYCSTDEHELQWKTLCTIEDLCFISKRYLKIIKSKIFLK